MNYFIMILVCFISSVIGSICGIGGGVIIKPVLDATGIMPVTTISFLSGCVVLSMTMVALYRNLSIGQGFTFNKYFATLIASGGVVGGIAGKELFYYVLSFFPKSNKVGALQAFILMILTIGTLLYTLNKEKISTKKISNRGTVFMVGFFLGVLSTFLGIGGGPINLVVLFYLFSMGTKEAALYSIYVIMFSQIANIGSTLILRCLPKFSPFILGLMIMCGVLGGIVGSSINKKMTEQMVERLFTGLMIVVIGINVFNIFQYM